MTDLPLAVVTGGAHRLGRSFALCLARRGYALLLHYHRSVDAATATAAQAHERGVPVFLFQADLSDEAQTRRLFTAVDETGLPLRVLVNSAARMEPADVRTMSAEAFDATLTLNLRAPLLCAQQAFQRMDSGGLIVNVTDAGARKVWSAFPAYTVSKAALEKLTQVLARAFAPKVRVNAIAPGLVLPADGAPSEEWTRLVNRLPLRRSASTDEIVSALEFLIESEYITGQTITVDGGYSLV